MSTVNQICAALLEVLRYLPGVDYASLDVFTPPVSTQSIALVIPPFGMETRVEAVTARRNVLLQSHRIPCEFWVKINTGNLPVELLRAREIGLEACRVLVAQNNLPEQQRLGGRVANIGYYGQGDSGPELNVEVFTRPVAVGQGQFIIVTVTVPVRDNADYL